MFPEVNTKDRLWIDCIGIPSLPLMLVGQNIDIFDTYCRIIRITIRTVTPSGIRTEEVVVILSIRSDDIDIKYRAVLTSSLF
jgi:hypothetical protein